MDRQPVVIDSGSSVLKVGIAGEDTPRVVFPTLYGVPKTQERELIPVGLKEYYTGVEAQSKRGMLSLVRPIQRGSVTDWDAMQKLWEAAFDQCDVTPADQPVLLSDPPLNPTANREMMAQVMFEKFGVPSLYVMTQGVLSMFASGRHAGVIVDVGDGVTQVMPIEGLIVRPQAVQRVNLAGHDLTCYLQRLMLERGYSTNDSGAGLEIARAVKESLCYVAYDYNKELSASETSSASEGTFTLPDGHVVSLNDQRFRVAEALFTPTLVGKDQEGLHELVYKSIMECDMDVRRHFYNNILLCGGTSLMPGLGERLQKEVTSLAPPAIKVSVVEPSERKYSVWIGGSILASLSTFKDVWVSKQQYEEHGPSVVLKMCS